MKQISYAQRSATPLGVAPTPLAGAGINSDVPIAFDARMANIAAPRESANDIVFHPGPLETRFTRAGVIHRGVMVEDAGAVHALLLAVLSGQSLPPLPAAACVLPERDPTRSAEQQGLFRKFDVRRTDGSDAPGGKHHGCRYFVLDMDHDVHAAPALRAYARDVAGTHPLLAADLHAQFGGEEHDVTVDRRDLFDFLRAAWRDGQNHQGEMDERERWNKATDHATAAMRSWTTLEHAGAYARAWQVLGNDMSVADLSGTALDFWVARAVDADPVWRAGWLVDGMPFSPSTNWAQGGPLIDQFQIGVDRVYRSNTCGAWIKGCHYESDDPDDIGETMLIAACRAIVRSVYGAFVTPPSVMP